MADRRITLFRHAKAAWPDDVDDIDRPLADRGEADAPVAGRWLAGQPLPSLVLCSPAVRARRTCELAMAALPDIPIRIEERIYAASAGDLLDVVHQLPGDTRHVMLVGHNPGLSHLAGLLAGERIDLSTAGIAVVAWTGSWTDAAPGKGRLVAAATPRAR
ncbi:SixA phosphatase family protein [Thermocrispum agreste]|uniref:SixA phosphatase family protein n=1 Tax=Thermocrispum agreste TaxID=37925 RepID=UPI0004225BBA|nr:histidine phosphatase family protein [Thermocrispum agreste]